MSNRSIRIRVERQDQMMSVVGRDGVRPVLLAGRCVVVLLITVLALGACGNARESGRDASASAAPEFNEADVRFARAMIPHGEQGADMSALVLDVKELEPGVRALATELTRNRDGETKQLEQWVAARGEPMAADAPHDHGGGEDGIATPTQMSTLDEASGTAAQTLYVEMMIKHHRGAVAAAQEEIAEGRSPVLVEFARMVLRTREAQLPVLMDAAARTASVPSTDENATPRGPG